MTKHQNSEDDLLNSNERIDHDLNDADAETDQPENGDWFHKKSYFNDDLGDSFGEEIEF